MKKIEKSLEVLNTQFNLVALLGVVFTGFNTFSQKFGLVDKVDKIISSILFGLLVVLASIYIIKYIKKPVINIPINDRELLDALKQKGIDGIQDEKINDFRKVTNKLKEAEHSIDFIAYHGDRFLNNNKEQLIKKIIGGVNVRILVAKEDSELINETMEFEGSRNNYRSKDIREIIYDITKNIESDNNIRKGTIKWYELNTEIRYSLTLIDGKWAWWTPYHTGIRVEDTTSFVLTIKDEDKTKEVSFINLCIKHFDELWRHYDRDTAKNK